MFWIINAIFILIALAFLLPSLLRKHNSLQDGRREQNIFIANEQLKDLEKRHEQGEIDSEDYQSTRDELEQSLFSDVSDADDNISLKGNSKSSGLSGILVALLIPVIAIPVYLHYGNQAFTQALDSKKAVANLVPKNANGTPDIDTMVAGLQKKMEADPNNAKGWFMLGRSYMVLKRYPDAVKSYERALKLKPESANIMLSLADSLTMLSNGEVKSRPVELINKALELEPNNRIALWLGGMVARQQGDSLTAIQRWKKVLTQVNDPGEREEVNSLIAEAVSQLTPEQKATLSTTANVEASPTKVKEENVKAPIVNGTGIGVMVSLSAEMKAKVNLTDTVFVYAKALKGPPMPLAAAKKQVKDLPFEVFLDDSMAMMPSMKLSMFQEVVVGARISLSGQPIAQNGDLYTEQKPVKAGDKVKLAIDTIFVK